MTNPLATGAGLALLAALTFGVATPFIQRFGLGLGPFTTACLLYLGAALGAVPNPFRSVREPAPGWPHAGRLVAVALCGAVAAPTLFAWGLQRTSATSASLLLNAEAVVTVGLAALVYREHVGRQVALAVGLMFLGGCLAVVDAQGSAGQGGVGLLAILGAVCCWALDNTLTRPLADLDPAAVVRAKAALGAGMTAAMALLFQEPLPAAVKAAGLLVCGVSGYGLSLRLYLLAQRRLGAGRTGSVFALAPFLGAVAALSLGDRSAGWATLGAAALFAAGVALHLTERHRHAHVHDRLVHDHAHDHADGHHDHVHAEGPAEGSHSHPHEHAPVAHSHPHGPDQHHRHRH